MKIHWVAIGHYMMQTARMASGYEYTVSQHPTGKTILSARGPIFGQRKPSRYQLCDDMDQARSLAQEWEDEAEPAGASKVGVAPIISFSTA